MEVVELISVTGQPFKCHERVSDFTRASAYMHKFQWKEALDLLGSIAEVWPRDETVEIQSHLCKQMMQVDEKSIVSQLTVASGMNTYSLTLLQCWMTRF